MPTAVVRGAMTLSARSYRCADGSAPLADERERASTTCAWPDRPRRARAPPRWRSPPRSRRAMRSRSSASTRRSSTAAWTSAPPSRARAERAAVPHHLIDIVDPAERYSAARFVADAARRSRRSARAAACRSWSAARCSTSRRCSTASTRCPAADAEVRADDRRARRARRLAGAARRARGGRPADARRGSRRTTASASSARSRCTA